ncbi:magnesium-translocating P-type ATPase [Rhodoblastus sphagnicola]|uniref:Magnesium-transporting ATPase, P-type 1 n=1 Tax=Rhodoblastus sphagnicola TaxID=333368 RepID=A0A2S6N4D4_9HYPH|nr:magnesium-translocating P-type ATPase [Rhodoblastus sphagnicola]MBB4200324.1 Mg2+-importing ATPase [Rhodoblastus sphagnicola]PPQ29476.1 magnesium-translocating P-type ATPase [Rhodoblastus sphagnicola]
MNITRKPGGGDGGSGHSDGDSDGGQISADAVWREPAARLLARLVTTPAGLRGAEAEARLAIHGPNDAATVKRTPLWLQFLSRFRNPLVIILLGASGLSAATGDIASFVIIASIVMASMTLDFVQEARAQSAVEALRRSVAVQATVRRDGAPVSVPIDRLVPGDIVELIAGDLVPADARLLESRDLFINQALLTGEPYPAEKHASDKTSGAENPAGAENSAEATNAVFAGTSVISGTATILVCRTGARTALGHLATSLAEKPPATAFAVGVASFGMLIMRLTILMVFFVLVVNISFHRPVLESLMFALALAVGLTPELLPMIVTVTMARSAMGLSRRKVIVKRLSAIHDLGAMDVLCTDKTGTLTEASIKLVRAIDGRGAESASAFAYAFINSHFETGMKSPLDEAILAAHPFDMAGWTKIDEVPFDFERRRISVLVEHDGKRRLIVKGAPEDLLRLSAKYEAADGQELPLDAETRRIFQATLDDLGAQGFRALGIAGHAIASDDQSIAVADESNLVFVGFAVFLDPPKASAGATIQALATAGVSVKVLTGDNELVARHVFKEIGVAVTGVLTGDDLTHLSEEALIAQVSRVNLFCRVNPQQKLRILMALKRLGHVVGYMGDGINDAPALHAADVGISVDGAADVARAAADLILLEHDLSVVREAVVGGRETVQNVSKYVLMGSSSNFGNMFSMAGAALFLPFLPMLPIQILLNNLLYDVSEIAIPFDGVDPEAVALPVKWDITFIERFMLVFGPVSSVFDFLTFYALVALFGAGAPLFQTGWFIESMTTQVLVVFAIRTRRAFFRSKPNGFLVAMALGVVAVAIALPLSPIGQWFGFVAPPPLFFAYLVGATLAYLALVEIVKIFFYRAMARR